MLNFSYFIVITQERLSCVLWAQHLTLDSEKASLESTLDSLEQESSRLETRFFTLTAQVKLVDTRIEMGLWMSLDTIL